MRFFEVKAKAAVLLFPLAASLVLSAQVTFRGGTSLVHVETDVREKSGRVITGLTMQDFRVLDEGKPQPLRALFRDDQPLDLVLMLDVSHSMAKDVATLTNSVTPIFSILRKGDRVAVFAFDEFANQIAILTDDSGAIARAIERVASARFRGHTAIQPSIRQVAERLSGDPPSERRLAILIVTDNIAIPSSRDHEALRALWTADASLYGLIVTTSCKVCLAASGEARLQLG